jgi:hypothetical protein
MAAYFIAASVGAGAFIGCGSDDSTPGPVNDQDGAAEASGDDGSPGAEGGTSPDATIDSGESDGGTTAADSGDASSGDASTSDAGETLDGAATDGGDASTSDAATVDGAASDASSDGAAAVIDAAPDGAVIDASSDGAVIDASLDDASSDDASSDGGVDASDDAASDGAASDGSPDASDGGPVCGDGIVEGTEQCDLGAAKNDNLFSTCSATCTTTTLLLYLDASDPNGTGVLPADGTPLAAWVDKANGVSVVQAASASQPVFTLSGINGQPSLAFQNDAIFDADLNINASVVPNVTVIAVIQNFTGITTSYSGVWGLDHGGWGRFSASGGTVGGNGVSNGGGFTPVTGLTATATPLVFTTVLNGSTANGSFAYVNGVLGATGSTVAGGTDLSIGSLNAPDHFISGYSMYGYIAEVLVYGSALSDSDRATVETALMTRY